MVMMNIIDDSLKDDKLLKRLYFPFKLDRESVNQPTYFQLQFIVNNNKHRYGFEYNNQRIISEWLYGIADKNEVYFFIRNFDEIKINENQFKEGKLLKDRTTPTNLFLNVVKAFNGEIAKSIIEQTNGIGINLNDDNNTILSKMTLDLIDNGRNQEIIDFLNFADLGVKSVNKRTTEIPGHYNIVFSREIKDKKGNPIVVAETSLMHEESIGTQKLFNNTGIIMYALANGTPFIIDEFESSLHPILAKKIVEMFHSSKLNKKGAQLIFATHDTNLLDANLLRRDQIFFTEKNKKNETELYSLYDFK